MHPRVAGQITGVPAPAAERIGREFAQNAVDTKGRSMIIMGAGTNHYFHSDTIYRAFLTLTTLTGCQGKNGGGWAHYVGQEKTRPMTGTSRSRWAPTGAAPAPDDPDRILVPRHRPMALRHLPRRQFSSPTGQGFSPDDMADMLAQSARLGLDALFPTFNRNPLDLCDAPARRTVPRRLRRRRADAGRLRFSSRTPTPRRTSPGCSTMWRANVFGSSGKGNEYFLRHLLGTDNNVRAGGARAPAADVTWRDEAPEGKLDLLLTLDFRMTSTTLFADVVLPAATWYEKHDLSTTDMHPFVHAFNPAISPPWQTRTDFDIFATLAERFSELAAVHLGTRTDVVAWPLAHDTPDELGMPHGRSTTGGRRGPGRRPGVDFPKLALVERDYPATAARMAALGPLLDDLGATVKGVPFDVRKSVDYLRARNGAVRGGRADGRPRLDRDTDMCEAILALSGTTNGHLAVQGFRAVEQRTGTRWRTWRRRTRASRSPSPTPRPRPHRSSPHPSGRGRRPAAAATRLSPSMSSEPSRGTR